MMEIAPRHRVNRGKIAALLGCAALLTIFSQTAWRAISTKSATFDEPLHLVSAYLQTKGGDFRCDPDNPPLWKYYLVAGTSDDKIKLPHGDQWNLMLHDVRSQDRYCADILWRTPGNDPDTLLRAARKRMLFFGVLLGATIAGIAWRLNGPLAGTVAVIAFCLDPNFLAHAPLVKNDVPIALLFLWLMLAIWLVGRRATLLRIFAVAVIVGVSLTTKFTGLFAIPILAIALFFRALMLLPWPVLRFNAGKRFHRLLAAAAIVLFSLLISYTAIWASCQFRFASSPEENSVVDLHDVFPLLSLFQVIHDHRAPWDVSLPEVLGWKAQWRPDAVVRSTLWLDAHRLLPQTYLRGFLYAYATTMYRGAFLCGHLSFVGWWYYFPLAMLFKTPLATLIALALWVGAARFFLRTVSLWTLFSFALFPIFYMAMSMHSDFDIGLRHVLPVYPFLFIFLGVAAAEAHRRQPRRVRLSVLILTVGLAAETIFAYPDFIPFFNVAAGGSRGGLALLGDSNIDWGEELPALVQWQSQHPNRQLYLYYFGSADPRYYGLRYVNLPGSFAPACQGEVHGLPSTYAISATGLQGLMSPANYNFYEPFRKTKPTAILGGSIYLYDSP